MAWDTPFTWIWQGKVEAPTPDGKTVEQGHWNQRKTLQVGTAN